jgi:excisionase family DNA binding protein
MASNEYLNLKEAARYLGVSDIKIRRLVSKGLLEVSYDPLDDRKRLVKKADLDTLKTPRPFENTATEHQGNKSRDLASRKKSTSTIKRGNTSNES